jgi:glycosyltransferase involved in cell wall biosynthesis
MNAAVIDVCEAATRDRFGIYRNTAEIREPLVTAICLTKDRPKMLKRAVESFRSQTYRNKWLLVLDGSGPTFREWRNNETYACTAGESSIGMLSTRLGFARCRACTAGESSIGMLRNLANEMCLSSDIIVHWDDDDWSHPNRITEQVIALQHSGQDILAYDEILFWNAELGQAWIYKNRLARAGSTFCYWRRAWERRQFPDLPRPERGSQGEDHEWSQYFNMQRISGAGWKSCKPGQDLEPRMICSIHSGNTTHYAPVESANWKRVPEWDNYCKEKMTL